MTAVAAVAATRPRRARRPFRPRVVVPRVVMGVLLAGYALVSLYPFLWMVSAAFKTREEMIAGTGLIPDNPTFATLADTWSQINFVDYFLNSVRVTAVTTVLVVIIYSLAAYGFAVLRFPGRDLLYKLFLALLFVPSVVTLLPIVLLERNLGILGTHLGLILPFVNGTAPLAVLLLTNAFSTVPQELRDAARVDGAGDLRIFRTVYLPIARPALITIALLTAIPTWNEYLLSRVSLNDPSRYTLPIGLQALQSETVVQYNVLMAGALIVVIPIVLLFLSAQRYFVNGLVGAVKG
ncbi:carbohydrate ABC transporter permease [Jiangella alkaliphila]|uniref:Multiple sugar transport system permease protein n=1 Tax=Jiangella alkaliphila TaxID=419479 RepID=A0A1H2LH36_9ACTN|nr:carbohydrate ABC transporter permease [Jiangella alkaliphila]SDU79716.1 multiple sugar transport system permease protein [Jiangella alkaliphila]